MTEASREDPGEVSPLDRDVRAFLDAGAPGDAVARILEVLGPDLLGYVAAILRDESEAREAFSEVSSQMLTAVTRFRGDGSVKAWAYKVAWRIALRARHAPHRKREQPWHTGLSSEVAAVVASRPAYARTDAKTWLATQRATLSPEDQSLLTLRVDRGLSWDEVAEVMEEPGGAPRLRKRFERLRERLREAAERDGVLDG